MSQQESFGRRLVHLLFVLMPLFLYRPQCGFHPLRGSRSELMRHITPQKITLNHVRYDHLGSLRHQTEQYRKESVSQIKNQNRMHLQCCRCILFSCTPLIMRNYQNPAQQSHSNKLKLLDHPL